jgi:hypothetical protein
MYASTFNLIQSGTFSTMYLYVASGSGQIVTGIYTDAGGQPDSLVVPCIPQYCTTGWNAINIPGGVHLTPGNYWLAWEAQAGIGIDYNTAPDGSGMAVSNSFGTFPDPFGQPSSQTRSWSIYTEFCADLGYLVTATFSPTITMTYTITLTPTQTPILSITPTPSITTTPVPALEQPATNDSYVFPVPATANITFVYSLSEQANVTIDVFDFAGNLAHKFYCTGNASATNTTQENISGLSPGIYYYIIKAKTVSGTEIKFKANKFLVVR